MPAWVRFPEMTVVGGRTMMMMMTAVAGLGWVMAEEAADREAVVAVADHDTSVGVAAVVAGLAVGRSDLAWRDCSSSDCGVASESVKM